MSDGADGRGPGPAPRWLTRIGWSGWMVAGTVAGGVALVAATAVLLPYLTPVVVAVVLAAVLRPPVEWLCRHRVPRAAAATAGALAVPALLLVLGLLVLRAVRGRGAEWERTAQAAAGRLRDATDVDPLTPLLNAAGRAEVVRGLAGTVVNGAAAVCALALGVLLAAYVLFFLLYEGDRFGAAIAGRTALPATTTRELLADAGLRLRRYVVGTTAVAAVDAVVITAGAAILRLPLLVVIAVVTFVAAFVPYLGAWLSGIFVVMVALGSGGLDTALWMLVIVLVTQNILEGLIRPLAFGKALDLHPLTVLAVTVAGGVVAGVVGVFIAPPLVAILLSWRRTVPAPRAAARTRDARAAEVRPGAPR